MSIVSSTGWTTLRPSREASVIERAKLQRTFVESLYSAADNTFWMLFHDERLDYGTIIFVWLPLRINVWVSWRLFIKIWYKRHVTTINDTYQHESRENLWGGSVTKAI
jgi:hypothetical protein